MNYDAPDDRWPASLKTAFEDYMKKGGGLVSVHAADNAFAGWAAFNEMIGVGGWRNRTEEAGPYLVRPRWQSRLRCDAGKGGSHGRRVPFRITVRDASHPDREGTATGVDASRR
jgi:hypothetical protein